MPFQTKLRQAVMVANGAVCWVTGISYHPIPGVEWHDPDAIALTRPVTQQ